MIMIVMRDYLIRLAIRHEGRFFKIRKALEEQEEISDEIPLQDAITVFDEDYPPELLELKYPPYVLFYRGDPQLLKGRKVAVVGSRDCSEYGELCTRSIVRALRNDFTVVSGMARGIDSVAHKNALRTIGVLGNGVDVVYPEGNRKLYERMAEEQLLISEYPASMACRRENFPFRNRIIAALSEAVIVPEARIRSGSMITVRHALDLGRDIYAVPHRLTDVNGSGCNRLLQLGASMILIDYQ